MNLKEIENKNYRKKIFNPKRHNLKKKKKNPLIKCFDLVDISRNFFGLIPSVWGPNVISVQKNESKMAKTKVHIVKY